MFTWYNQNQQNSDLSYTVEGGRQYQHSLDHHLEFFSKAGSMRDGKGQPAFYENRNEDITRLFQSAWIVDKTLAMKLLLWVRDCRGGAGNRSGFRKCLQWLAIHEPDWVRANLGKIPEYGRWDDLRGLFETSLKYDAAEMWGKAISENGLAAKWAKREDRLIQRYLRMNIADFRRYLANQRRRLGGIVETRMCQNEWNGIEYSHVPSVAMARYTNAFAKHDADRFQEFKNKVQRGEAKINAGALFPHDCVMTVFYGDSQTANLQFAALPDFIKTDEKIIAISDTSGSMSQYIGGSRNLMAVHISQALALYCSDRIGKGSPFYRKFIGFCSESKFKDWERMSFSQAVRDHRIFDGAVGSTRIDTALDLILTTARTFSIPDNMMPTMLLILSDMQFHSGGVRSSDTEVKGALRRWTNAGYSLPKIVYWNLAGYAGSPATANEYGAGLVSGFSPSILTSVLACEDFTPKGIMLKTLEKYEVNVPA